MYSIGVDFGTASCRAILYNSYSEKTIKTVSYYYKDDEMIGNLQNSIKKEQQILQDPQQYIDGLIAVVTTLMNDQLIDKKLIVAMGIDFTSCTCLPVDKNFMPYSQVPIFKNEPNAYAKLWKSHSAQKEANHINDVLKDELLLSRYGGSISSEWLLPKLLEVKNDAPALFKEMDLYIEAGDWLVSKLTNTISRSSCHAGFKGLWEKKNGYLSQRLLNDIDSDFSTIYDTKLRGTVQSVGTIAGTLCEEFSELLNLHDQVAVSVSLIDAHAAVPGAKISTPGVLQVVMGTSTCHLLLSEEECIIPGVAGVVEDGILPGLYAYEAGQAAVGDLFASFIQEQLPPKYSEAAHENNQNIYDYLNSIAEKEQHKEHGLVILDWHHGNRSPYMNQQLSGVVIGEKLSTTAIDRYRALLESTAFGTRQIIELFTNHGVAVNEIIFTGGIPLKNEFLMQLYADVLQRPIQVISVPEIPAVGAARLAIQASGKSTNRDNSKVQSKVYQATKNTYEEKYTLYQKLGETLHKDDVMRMLFSMQNEGD
ncbi:ribulokinase [Kurthia sibirica]|uniref:Ribulokinase n=1 Tax=Kurthia sibirica TaxID=202750 RepID=A0A2U3AK11_9BACL|nr:ribulokinase [Kurthia sibirica]PWI24867.1 ribulokinase [Kurthia sibirica]GEK35212.1 ribulokinase [Kurthia sibirica]